MGRLAAVGLLGLAVRVAYTIVLGQDVELGITDATFYGSSAQLLADGEGYVDLFRSFEEGDGELLPTAHHPPGWPALLAVPAWFGVETELGLRLVGAVVGAAVVLLVGLVARRVAGPTAGLVAALVAALHPTLVAADGSLMSETLAGLVVLVSLLLGLRVARTGRPAWAVALGISIGLGALVRGEALLHLALLALPVALVAARRATSGRLGTGIVLTGLAVVGTVAVVAPWTARNAAVLGEPVLISTNDSTVLAGANCPSTYEGSLLGGWDLACVQGGSGSEVADAARWREQGLDHLRGNVDRLPVVVGARLLRTWGLWDPLTPVAEGRDVGIQRIGNLVWLGLLLPAAIAGAVVLGRRRRWAELVVLLAPVGASTVVTVVGFGMLRFRHPMELSAVVLTGVAVDALVRRRRPVAAPEPAVVGS